MLEADDYKRLNNTDLCNVINTVHGTCSVFQNAYYFYYYHKEGAPKSGNSEKAFQESWFLSENIKNEKE